MAPSPSPVTVLSRRADLLRALRDEPRSKPALADELSVSRSTVDRAVRELEAEGFVERSDGVSLTLHGRLALDGFETLSTDLTGLDAATEALGALPDDARVDTALFRGADVVEASPVAPQRATETYRSLVTDATRIRGYASALLDSTVPTIRDRIVDQHLEMDLVVDSDVLTALAGTHGDALADARASGGLELQEATEGLAYSLMLVETPATTVVTALFYDERSHTGLVSNDTEDAVAWAEDVYADLRAAADPLPK